MRPEMEPSCDVEVEETQKKSNTYTAAHQDFLDEQEEALVALIEHRTKEVEHLRHRVTYYKAQLDEAGKRLESTKLQLARLRARNGAKASQKYPLNGNKEIKVERRSTSPVQLKEGSSQNHDQSQTRLDQGNVKSSRNFMPENQRQSRPQLLIPSVNSKSPQTMKTKEPEVKLPTMSSSRASSNVPSQTNSLVRVKVEIPQQEQAVEVQHKGTKRKLDLKEHKELIPSIGSSASPCTIRCQTGCLVASQHKRKLRSLVLCPTNDQLFVTSALDGVVNLWELQGRGSNANLLSSTDCVSAKHRRWPEDIAWHPEGHSIFSVYSADGADSQISILDLNKTKERSRVRFLEEKPHVKGIINNIIFMPWDDVCFATAGSDHAVVLWTDEGEEAWKPKTVHRSMHSSAVMGVAGMQQKQTLLSVGADKRIIGFDLKAGRAEYQYQIESKCMSVLTNPCDFNLFMVQTGTPERQLRLLDIRLRRAEIHAFGWKQESSESQSALINQTWSPDGLYLTSGSADPMIHLFDIRYNARKPSQSVRAHQKRVFKAAWHRATPLLVSISSDLNIGLHKII